MAGLIKREDIDEVRQRTDIKEVVDGYVTLKGAGLGTFKGLCPFHDERSPSFTVRPQVGRYHCFGCGEDGDVISFVQKMDHTSFQEAVEKLAARIGYELRYEDGGTGPSREEVGRRQRLLDAHKIADEYFRGQLLTPGASEARKFLQGRGFDRAAAEQFSVGYAPQGWDALLKHLRRRGFTDAELKLTGMFSTGGSGNQERLYDRFRGRLVWPIRDIAGDTIGFGARKLYEEDQGPKYLNTPETTLYKKSQVLYGIDLAKRSIAKERQLVVVEGYTDVMACHLAGIATAVATCGTAFGAEHIKIARRLLSDDGSGGEVIFTFDGDAAGQKAALRAFEEDQRFVAQTYVAVEPSGADPCDLRQLKGDDAVRELIGTRRPLFEFAIRATLKRHNLDTVEGRIAALRESAPVIARIRDSAMRPAYARALSGWLGMPMEDVDRAVGAAIKRGAAAGAAPVTAPPGARSAGARSAGAAPGTVPAVAQSGVAQSAGVGSHAGSHAGSHVGSHAGTHGTGAAVPPGPVFLRPDPHDPVAAMERQALEVVLQEPGSLAGEGWDRFTAVQFTVPAYGAVHTAVRATGLGPAGDPVSWVEHIRQEVPEPLRPLVSELAVVPLPASTPEAMQRYCRDILARLFELQITRVKADKMGQLQRLDPAAQPEDFQRLNRELMELEMQRRALRADS